MNTPNRSMQAFIVIVLLALYATALLLPAFMPEVQFDEAMKQTLLNLVIAAVSYFIGTSATSAKKDDTIAGLSQLPAKDEAKP